MAEKKAELRFILLGKTGEGKSATGNFILRKEAFVSMQRFNSVTHELTSCSAFLDERKVTVVDTPGLFDNTRPMLQTAMEVQKSLDHVKPGPHAFLLVIKFGRFTDEGEQILGLLSMMFGQKLFNYTIVIFTHEDQVKTNEYEAGDCMKTFMENTSVKKLLDECGGRYITLNNFENSVVRREGKLERLLRLANEVSRNGKNTYAENIDIYRNVLQKHVHEWNIQRLTGEQIKTILREQVEEMKRQMIRKGVKVAAGAGAVVVAGAAVYVAAPAAAGAAAANVIGGVMSALPLIGRIFTHTRFHNLSKTDIRNNEQTIDLATIS